MKTSNTNVDFCINKIKMIRPNYNPRNCDLNLSIDWNIEYIKLDEESMEYVCTLKSIDEMPLQFAIKGFLRCKNQVEDLEKRSDEISPIILDKCMKTMMKMVNITKNDILSIKTIPEAYLNCIYGEFKN